MLYFRSGSEWPSGPESEDGLLDVLEDQQAQACLALLESGLVTCGPTGAPGACQRWIEALQREREGVRRALAWLAERGDAGRGMRLAHAVLCFWSARHRARRQEAGHLRGAGAPALVLGDMLRGEHALARMLCAESRRVVASIGARQRRAGGLAWGARAALTCGRPQEASAGFRAAAGIYRLLGNWAAATECTRLADSCSAPAAPSGPMGRAAATQVSLAPLSPREQQVALLITRGYTSRGIAGELHITERTARTHVAHILTKLGMRSRAQVAAWVAAHRPEPNALDAWRG